MKNQNHGIIDGGFQAGQIVWVLQINGIENLGSTGKWRPAMLVERRGGQWSAMCLTTQPRYRSTGGPRVPFPHGPFCGLDRPSYLWSGRPSKISALDLGDPIGHAGPEVLPALFRLGAPRWVVDAIRAAVSTAPVAGEAPEAA